MKWRLGADLGASSLGWAVIEVVPVDGVWSPRRIVAAGSRIFSDGREPKSGASLAGARRDARAMRRRRDRFKQRQAALIKYLTLDGFFPVDEEERRKLADIDPYELRAKALDEALPPAHLGRALFHLNQRRGFKSNRKTDRGSNDDDSGKIRIGVARLHEQMQEAGAETLGQFLHRRRAKAKNANAIPHVRTRIVTVDAEDGKAADVYDFYPDRQMLEDEFEAIWDAQAPHHPELLTPERKQQFHEIIFHQRSLKEPKAGYCTLLPPEPRLPKAHPLFQRRRLLEELNALKVVLPGAEGRVLEKPERDALLSKLAGKKAIAYASLRKALKLDPDARFNKESDNRKDMKGDEVAAEMSHAKRFGKTWLGLSPETQWEVVDRLRQLESDEQVADFEAWLRERHALSREQARSVTGARLPEGYGRFGETATRALVEELQKEVIVYSEAVSRRPELGHHSDFRDGQVWQDKKGNPALPYYGAILERHILPGTAEPEEEDEALRIGRLTNPTVHIGLNQLRRVLNTLIRRYGPPVEIAIELARELKLDEERKREINSRNRENREAAEKRSKKLQELGQADKGGNRALLKLWEELNRDNVLDRRCVYSGRKISMDMLFSGAVEVDHILPFSATLDDSGGNRILCLREVNRIKRKRTPWEARADLRTHFGPDAEWEAIAARAARLPKDKRWRFEPDAIHRFDAQGGFLARHLTDTQHLSRLAREYLSALYPERGEGSSHVWVSPGRLTEMLRRAWSLNHHLPDHNLSGANQPKNRKDHRHHAIDAIVVAVTDRGMLNRISRETGRHGHEEASRVVADIPEPWEGFSDAVGRAVRGIVVSHRPDHGTASKAGLSRQKDATAARLHNETAYGLTGEKDARGLDIVVTRKPLSSFKKAADLDAIRDGDLRQKLKDWTAGKEGGAFEQALRAFGHPERGPRSYPGLRRIRVVEPLSVIRIRDREGRAYKAYKGDSNYRFDMWELKTGKWKDEVVSMFEAHQRDWVSPIRAANPTARKVLSLQQNDVIAIERENGRELLRVVKFTGGQVALAPPQDAGSLKARDADKDDPFKYVYGSASALQRWKARQVRIDELGRVLDPGFPARKPRPGKPPGKGA